MTSARRSIPGSARLTTMVRAVAVSAVPLALVAASAMLRTPAAAAPPAAAAVSSSAAAHTSARAAAVPGRALRIMPLGDSITMGIGSAALNSYRPDLYRRLTAATVTVDFVGSSRNGTGPDNDHEGHSGWTIDKISRHVDGWLATYRPDVILLHIGTNDLRVDAPATGAVRRLAALIRQIQADLPTAQILVSAISGTRHLPAQQRRTDAYNAAIPALVAARGPRVHLVDQSSVRGVDLRDGLHPNEFGFEKMSWNLYRALEGVIGRAHMASWPAAENPYRATSAYRCILVGKDGDAARIDCSWWYLRAVKTTLHGGAVTRRVWQTRHRAAGRTTWVSDLGWQS